MLYPTAYDLKRQHKEKQVGRPVNKRYFGKNANNNLRVTFKTSGVEYDGYILSQRSTRRFKVSDGTHTAVCTLVNKNAGSLADGEMLIQVLLDTGELRQVTKLYNRVAVVEGETKMPWTFVASTTDDKVQVIEEAAGAFVAILTQPEDVLVDLSESLTDTATFTVSVTGVGDATYQWQKQEAGIGDWTNITGATSASYTTGTLTVASDDGDNYRVVISSATASNSPLTSAVATLTVQE